MTEEQQFTVELYESRGGNRIQVRLSETGSASVAVQLAREQKPVMWSGQALADRQEKIRTELAKGLPHTGGGMEFQIKIGMAGKPAIARAWNSNAEGPQLRELRRDVELVAHVPYVLGQAFLERGNKEQAASDYAAAVQSYRAGIDELGNLYSHSNLDDDTGMKLVLAESNESQGNLKGAAAVYRRVLESRLHDYAIQYKLK